MLSQNISARGKKKIVIVGNGFGGVFTLKYLHKYLCGKEKVQISLVGPKNYFLFTPLMHEVATGSVAPENTLEPIRKVLGCCLAEFYLGKVDEVSIENRHVRTGGHILPYDYLVLAAGAETNYYNVPGAKEHTLALKTIEDAIRIKNHVVAQMEKAVHLGSVEARRKALCFAVVGGGPTGVELASELEELIQETFSRYYQKELLEDTSVVLIHKEGELLNQFGKKIRGKSLEVLRKKGVKVMLDAEVAEVGRAHIETKGGGKIEAETVIWVAGVKPVEIKFDQEVTRAHDGRLLVDDYLRLENQPEIFALGDMAAVKSKNGKFLPMMAQVASKEAQTAAKNIYLSLKGKKLKPLNYRHTGHLVSLGQWMAVGEVANFTFWGHLTWLLWRGVYLSKLISFRKKVKVALDWIVNAFSPRDISQF